MSLTRPVKPTFTVEEAGALLWAVRSVDSEALRRSPYHGDYDRACGHGALSSATNRLEAATGDALRGEQDEEGTTDESHES